MSMYMKTFGGEFDLVDDLLLHQIKKLAIFCVYVCVLEQTAKLQSAK